MADLTIPSYHQADLNVPSYHRSIAAVAWRGNVYAFGIGSQRTVIQYLNSSGTNFTDLGGYCNSPPVIVAPESGNLSLYVVGGDRAAYVKWYDGNRWFPGERSWTPLRGSLSSSLAAVGWGSTWDTTWVTLYGRGDDNSYRYGSANPSFPDTYPALFWKPFGGSFVTEPTVVPFGSWFTWVIGREPDGNYAARSRLDRPWEKIGGNFVGPPSSLKLNETRGILFGIDRSGGLKVRFLAEEGVLGQWETLPSRPSTPEPIFSNRSVQGITFRGTKRFEIFAVDQDNVLVKRVWTESSLWGPWIQHFGGCISAPAIASANSSHIEIFGLNADHNLVHQAWYGGKWSPSVNSVKNLGGWFHNFD